MANKFTYTRKQLDRLFKGIFEGNVNPANLPEDLYKSILHVLSDAVVRGFGKGTLTDEMQDLLGHFDHNVAVFSAAKTHHQIYDMTRALIDPETGFKRSFSAFKAEAGEIFDTYNVNWLETEYRTAFNNAFGARQWSEFERDRDLFPVIRYETAGDERVREEHAELDGIVRHIDDPFWRRWFPPNGWRCRCDATNHEVGDLEFTPDDVLATIEPPDTLFDMNPAIDKVIFDPNHPYTARVAERYRLNRDRNFDLPVPPKPQPKPPVKRVNVEPKGFENRPKNFGSALGIKMPAEFFGLLKKKPELKAYRKSDCTQDGTRVRIDTQTGRHVVGSEEIKRVVAHEFGHAVHGQHGIFTWRNMSTPWAEFEEPYQKARKLAGVGARGEKAKAIGKRHMIFEQWNQESRDLRQKIADENGLTVGSKREKEMFLAAADTIGALTHEKYGHGHGKSYYQGNGGYMSRAEFFAHCWESEFYEDNIYLRVHYPEIAEQMDEATKGVRARIERKK